MNDTTRADYVSLAGRLGLLQAVRVAMGTMAVIAAAVVPERTGAGPAVILPLTVAYVVATTVVEVARRRLRIRGLGLVGGILLVDGVYVATVTALGGGSVSVLSFLAMLHVIAVTLLLSYRWGLKIALWHVLLTLATFSGETAGLLHGVVGRTDPDGAVLYAVALLVVATATAGFSAVNERELRRGKTELAAMADMGAAIELAVSSDEIAQALVGHVVPSLGFRRGVVVAGTEDPDTVVRQAWAAREPVLVKALDTPRSPRLSAQLPDATNVVVLGLVADGDPVGALALEWGGPPRAKVPARVLAMATQFAAHAALAMRNAALRAEVARLATTDALTGLANRRVFEESLHRELARSARSGEPCGLIVLDVDHFKSINDRYGHQTGDEVLRHLGRVLAESCREADLPARYGGEEFVVIAPGVGGKTVALVAERLRHALAEADGPLPFTVSAGVASFPANAADDAALVAAADAALYQSKRNGRDRVTASRRRARRLELAS